MTSCLPLLDKNGPKNEENFYSYNINLLTIFLHSQFLSLLSFLFLAFLFFLLESLFSIKIKEKSYFKMFYLSSILVATFLFLGKYLKSLKESKKLPITIFQIIGKYILIPFFSIYLIVFYIYILKILIEKTLPKGTLVYICLSISFLSIFLSLILYSPQNKSYFIKKLVKFFSLFLLPILIILFIAIGVRIQQYGLSIYRYIVLLTGIWITITSFYIIFGGKKISFIPKSLIFFLIFFSFGPWGIFSLPEKNQVESIIKILEEKKLLDKNGKFKNEIYYYDNKKSSKQNKNQEKYKIKIFKKMEYLEKHHSLKKISSIFKEKKIATDTIKPLFFYSYKLGIPQDNMSLPRSITFNFKEKGQENLDYFTVTKNYQLIFYNLNKYYNKYYDNPIENKEYKMDSESLSIILKKKKNNKQIKISLEKKIKELYNQKSKEAKKKNSSYDYFHLNKKIIIKKETSFFKIKLEIDSIRCSFIDNKPIKINSLSGILLLKEKK